MQRCSAASPLQRALVAAALLSTLSATQAQQLFLGDKPAEPAAESRKAEQARGLLEPQAEALLSSQIAARVLELPFDAGDAFAKGAVLARLDCNIYEAQNAAARAEVNAARVKLESDRELARLNSIGVLEVQLSEARLRKAEAEQKVNQVFTEQCVIRAPWAGRVVERRVNAFESIAPNTPLLAIVAQAAPEIRLIVPSTWLPRLRPGTAFRFRIDETGVELPATVSAVGARIDAVSQTVPLRARFDGEPAGLVAGMSGTALFNGTP